MAIDEPPAHTEHLTGTETVLLVEDNEALLKMESIGKIVARDRGTGIRVPDL